MIYTIRICIYMTMAFMSAENQSGSVDLSVCDVLSELDSERDKPVSVTGIVVGFDGRHGVVLFDRELGVGPCPRLLRAGKRWPSGISLSWSSEIDEAKEIERILAPIRAAIAEREKLKRYDLLFGARFIGILRTRDGLRIGYHKKSEAYFGNGFGQFGQYPAELVVEEVRGPFLIEEKDWKAWKPEK
jgi:hypothetical protein